MASPKEILTKGIKIEALDDMAVLKCSADGMELVLVPEERDYIIDPGKLDAGFLEANGIKHGILSTPIFQEDGSVLIAKGTPAQDGQDSIIEYRISLPGSSEEVTSQDEAEKNKEKKEFYKDPLKNNNFINVQKDQTIAVKTPPTPGVPGQDIFGEPVQAKEGQWIPFKIGEGVEVSTDDMSLKSVVNGIVILDQDGRINVKEEWTLDGSVDISTGHVSFWGRRLEVTGSVLGGMRVETEGDLTINGSVEDEATIEVKGNLEVKGIIRAQETRITVKRNMRCRSIERSTICVKGDLEVEDYILDAKCTVGGNIRIIQGKGLLLGGETYVGGSLAAKVLGGPANVPTLIHVGYDPSLEKELEKLIQEIEETGSKISDIKNGLWKVEMMEKKGSLSKKMLSIKTKLVSAYDSLTKYQALTKSKIEALHAKMAPLQNATVTVQDIAHANTKILIYNAALQLKNDVAKAIFKFKRGKIITTDIPV